MSEISEQLSGGSHTFEEMYAHRHALWMALATYLPGSWKSLEHEEGGPEMFDGYFIAGATLPEAGPVTYHLPSALWAVCPGMELPHAPAWDGHTPDQVVDRLIQHVESADRRGVGG
jgi:hypothetical protein